MAYGLGQYFQDLGHSFSPYGPPSRQITYIRFLICGIFQGLQPHHHIVLYSAHKWSYDLHPICYHFLISIIGFLSLFVLYVAPQNALLTTSVFEVGVGTFLIRLLFILISPGKVSEPFRLLFAMVSTYFLLPAPLHLIDLQG